MNAWRLRFRRCRATCPARGRPLARCLARAASRRDLASVRAGPLVSLVVARGCAPARRPARAAARRHIVLASEAETGREARMTTTESAPTEVAARLADRFDEDGLPYAFGGALALGAWGVPRTTTDVDIPVFVAEPELDRLLDSIERSGAMVDRSAARRSVASTVWIWRICGAGSRPWSLPKTCGQRHWKISPAGSSRNDSRRLPRSRYGPSGPAIASPDPRREGHLPARAQDPDSQPLAPGRRRVEEAAGPLVTAWSR